MRTRVALVAVLLVLVACGSVPTTATPNIAPTQTRQAELAQLAAAGIGIGSITPTSAPVTMPTDTPRPPTETPVPPTATVIPTPVPPTPTPLPSPTATMIPLPATPPPTPNTETPVPPTATPVPTAYHVQYFNDRNRPLVGDPLITDVTGDEQPEHLYITWEPGGCRRGPQDQGIVYCFVQVTVFSGATVLFDSQRDNQRYSERTTVDVAPSQPGFSIREPGGPNRGPTVWTFRWAGAQFALENKEEGVIVRPTPTPRAPAISMGQLPLFPRAQLGPNAPSADGILTYTVPALTPQVDQWMASAWKTRGLVYLCGVDMPMGGVARFWREPAGSIYVYWATSGYHQGETYLYIGPKFSIPGECY